MNRLITKNKMWFLNFEVWVKDVKVFDLKFGFSTPKSVWGQVLR